jgi:hypothetical protein
LNNITRLNERNGASNNNNLAQQHMRSFTAFQPLQPFPDFESQGSDKSSLLDESSHEFSSSYLDFNYDSDWPEESQRLN